ncbi:MAG: LytR/AlgR family response regulator transcription factor [Butyrivibrio sp.]
MIRIAVCDDSPEFLQQAGNMVERWSEQSNTPAEIYRFDNGDALLAKNAVTHMDIIFLDIIMPLLNGIDTAKELRLNDNAVKIIFLTSSPEFALDSYEVKAQDYLLKPVTYEKVKETLDECSHAFETESKNIILKTSFGYQKLYFHDIEYAEAQNKKVVFYLRTGKTVEAVEPLRSLEERISENDGFFKCHRSYLVYLPNVDHFSMTEIIAKSGRSIPIARGYGKAFKEAYFSFVFGD